MQPTPQDPHRQNPTETIPADEFAFIQQTTPQDTVGTRIGEIPRAKKVLVLVSVVGVVFALSMIGLTIVMSSNKKVQNLSASQTSQKQSDKIVTRDTATTDNADLNEYSTTDTNGDGIIDGSDTYTVSDEDISWWQNLIGQIKGKTTDTTNDDEQVSYDDTTTPSDSFYEEPSDSSAYENEYLDDTVEAPVIEYEPSEKPATTEPAGGSTMTIASWNTLFTNSTSNIKKGSSAVSSKADIIGFQELHQPDRRKAMRDTLLCSSCAYAGYVHNYSTDGSNPGSLAIVWKKSRFNVISSGYYKVSDPETIKTSTGTTGNRISAKWITWAKLSDKSTGKEFYVLNTHTVASLESRGKPMSGEGDRVANYKHHMDVLTSKLKVLKASGLPVFVTGDFNVNYRYDVNVHYKDFPYARLGTVGVHSNWQRLNLAGISKSIGSHGDGNRIIDYVWIGDNAAVYPKTLAISGSRYGSDHSPVYLTLNLH